MLSIKGLPDIKMHVNTKQRRRHSEAFKFQVLAACAEPLAGGCGSGFGVQIERQPGVLFRKWMPKIDLPLHHWQKSMALL